MIVRRRTMMRWGYRLGSGVGYFTDPDMGAVRRSEMLSRLESVGGRTRVGPMISWLRELNDGRIGPPPGRDEMAPSEQETPSASDADGGSAAGLGDGRGGNSDAETSDAASQDGSAEHANSFDDLTIVEHPHAQ